MHDDFHPIIVRCVGNGDLAGGGSELAKRRALNGRKLQPCDIYHDTVHIHRNLYDLPLSWSSEFYGAVV
jgi:hypothetical protein